MVPVPDDNRSDNRDGSAAGTAERLAREGRRARQLEEQARALVDAAPQLAGEVAAVEGEVAQT
jgi:hypothetical protein